MQAATRAALDPPQRILENLTVGIMVLDEDLQVTYINPACEMLMATSARKALACAWPDLVQQPDSLGARIHRALQTGHPFTDREVQFELSSGRAFTADCTVTPLAEPRLAAQVLVEFQLLDRHLRISREEGRLAQQHATRGLVRGLAHEIKNPLGGLRGAAQLLERELPDDDLREYTQVIIAEADRLQSLMDRMLGPNTLPAKRAINLHQVVERVRQLVLAEAPPDVVVHRDYDPSVPDLVADMDQLIQALLNLVRNAVQAVGEQGTIILRTRTRRQVTIGQVRHKLMAVIEVVDNGPGIAPEMLEEIFFPMISGRAGGSGLGLPIAQSVAQRHGGLIECSSEVGHTVFRMMLPFGV